VFVGLTFTLKSGVFPAKMRVRFTAFGVQALACLAAGNETEQAKA
jgi:hypothetical protein